VIRRLIHLLALAAWALAACGGNGADVAEIPELPPASSTAIEGMLQASAVPVVVNVWASWCIPCRSEGPLLERAAEQFGAEVRFVGLNVRDSQNGARAFIAEFFPTAPIEHWFDQPGNVPVDLGGSRAVPLTFFYAAGGTLVDLHIGVLDERTLALAIDELLARG
jgi:cytochrome c biogenesis protein CcmG/thiol:disulfide interchange protein DsbE